MSISHLTDSHTNDLWIEGLNGASCSTGKDFTESTNAWPGYNVHLRAINKVKRSDRETSLDVHLRPPGLFEEILFRGVIQQWLDANIGALPGLGVTSILFGLAHNPIPGASSFTEACYGANFGLLYMVSPP